MTKNVVAFLALLSLIAGCEQPVEHAFYGGDCVLIKLSGERAMVTRMYVYQRRYIVRVFSGEVTQSAVFGPEVRDGGRRYAEISFDEFELEKCTA